MANFIGLKVGRDAVTGDRAQYDGVHERCAVYASLPANGHLGPSEIVLKLANEIPGQQFGDAVDRVIGNRACDLPRYRLRVTRFRRRPKLRDLLNEAERTALPIGSGSADHG